MIKNTDILKGISFENLDDEKIKKSLIDKFSKNLNKEIIPGVNYIPVSGKVLDDRVCNGCLAYCWSVFC
jgi:hypothetical protein